MPPSKSKPAKKTKTVADLAGPATAAATPPKASGIKVVAIRIADFRSLTNIEVELDDLTVLVGANNRRRPRDPDPRPGGLARRQGPREFLETFRSCRCRRRRVHQSSIRKKTSGSSCDRTGCRTESSNPSTTSSITAATPGTPSSISPGKSCPSHAAIGLSSVSQFEDWYKSTLCML